MNRAYATFRLPDGRSCSLGVGELVGRLWSAALQIDDPRVSEGHAMLSLRSGDLWLLALRRRLAVEGRSVAEVRLVAGQRIALAQGIELEVLAVELPATALAIEAPGLPTMILPGLCSLQVRPQIQVFARYEVDAACLLWDTDDGWRRAQGGVTTPLAAGDTWSIEGVPFRAVEVAAGGAGPSPTRVTGGIDPPLRIVTAWETVHVQVGDAPPVIFAGVHARILSELAALGGPAGWEVVAREVWPEEEDAWVLRKRWDVNLGRLRARLREGGIRTDLVRAAGTGQVELVLRHSDVLEDRS
ncbi:hypothetical protein [Nannocystis sp.]|uniref:hypothetical protein n=1 Tax=Nannocystis sp. TaxID=1962667 RepID=UPI002429F335|nr:hypothetical protein [Nannocystis sp.]MBK7824385.1 hypothetical protein [Nannocystis sp.]MBK9754473.1 hypothetical protein [Nannocystis sp.]